MIQIQINSKVHGVNFVKIDDDDFELVSKYKWHIHKGTRTNYAASCINENGKIRILLMHKLIKSNFKILDHKDGDGLNNQKLNIRPCSKKENNRNCRPSKNNRTGAKGVSYSDTRKRYESKICVDYKTIHLGRFKELSEAINAYNKAAIKYFGDFARINS